MYKFIILFLINTSLNISAKSPYDNTKSELKSLETIFVITDTTLIEQISKQDYGLNKEYNFEEGKLLFKIIQKTLSKKLNAEFKHSLNTIGLKSADNTYILDSTNPKLRLFLPVIENYIEDSSMQELINIINPIADTSYDSSQPSFGMHKKYQNMMLKSDFSSIKNLKIKENEAVLLLMTSGVKVPTKTSVKGAVATSILTLGLLSVAKVSVTNMNLLLISHDGKLLWSGKVIKKGVLGKEWMQTILFKKTLKKFPIKSR